MLKYTFLLLALCCFVLGRAQRNRVETITGFPKEKVYVHLNSSMPFVGEYLYFKVYCLQGQDNRLSDISKVAYITIIDKEGNIVHSQTIDVEDGMGYGDFFLPTSIASGNYKLIAYTRWMTNNRENTFFAQDVFIINPYTSAQDKVRRDSVDYKSVSVQPGSGELIMSKKKFGNREKVEVRMANVQEGFYSVSVRRLDSLPHPEVLTAESTIVSDSSFEFETSEVHQLPDLRGKLIKGHISATEQQPLKNKRLSLTFPGKDFFLRISSTDDKGNFYFSVDENFVEEEALVQVMDDATYTINFDSIPTPDVKELSFRQFGIDSLAKRMILDRSVHNQIENAYFSFKPDTVAISHHKNLFEGADMTVYNLDDYTRFPSVKETFVEIIRFARVRKENGKYNFGVFGYPPNETYGGQPLVLVDGLPLKNVNDFVESYKAAKISTIKIIRDNYFLGGSIYNGVIIIETINGDFADDYYDEDLKRLKLTTGNIRKNYFQQNYEEFDYSSIPDYRNQLLWLPSLEKENFKFYTSDLDGIFEISLEGFTKKGEPVSLKGYFRVE